MESTGSEDVSGLLEKLDIPAEFAQYDSVLETDVIVRLETWRRQASSVLSELRGHLDRRKLAVEEKANVVSAVAQFDGEGPWILEPAREQARGSLALFGEPDIALLERILNRHVKPIFQSNPHPSLNLDTGRTLPRTAGGPSASMDHFRGQAWKEKPGAANLVSWCVRHMETSAYERLWHLVIPPVMALLDDFEAPHKLRGIKLVAEMLQRVPDSLLRRTGVDGLLFSSLKTSLTFLHTPHTPALIRAATPAALALTRLTTAPGSAPRFERLCALLGDGLIGSVWLYAERDTDALAASLDVLPGVVDALGIGAARYLKALVPQLVLPLACAPEGTFSTGFQRVSADALCAVVCACAPRVHRWKGTITGGVVRCWATLAGSGAADDDSRELRRALRTLCARLADACPSVIKEEYARLLQADTPLFGPLLARLDNSQGSDQLDDDATAT